MKIENPLIELLAIKLYEHDGVDAVGSWPPKPGYHIAWMRMPDEDREIYRKLARGEDDLDE